MGFYYSRFLRYLFLFFFCLIGSGLGLDSKAYADFELILGIFTRLIFFFVEFCGFFYAVWDSRSSFSWLLAPSIVHFLYSWFHPPLFLSWKRKREKERKYGWCMQFVFFLIAYIAFVLVVQLSPALITFSIEVLYISFKLVVTYFLRFVLWITKWSMWWHSFSRFVLWIINDYLLWDLVTFLFKFMMCGFFYQVVWYNVLIDILAFIHFNIIWWLSLSVHCQVFLFGIMIKKLKYYGLDMYVCDSSSFFFLKKLYYCFLSRCCTSTFKIVDADSGKGKRGRD